MFKRAFVEKLVPAFYYWYHLNKIYLQDEDPSVLYSKGREFAQYFVLMTNRERERYTQRLRDDLLSFQYNPINLANNDLILNDEEIHFLENL